MVQSRSLGLEMKMRCFHFVVLAIHAFAILIFTRGFLLTRTELPHHTRASDISQSPCLPPNTTSPSWSAPAVDRFIIIILDALRYDFLAPSAFFEEKKPWMDKLTVLQNLAFAEGSPAKIFKFVADPPTTTTLRLKGLTMGGMPTFIDVGTNFGAPEIAEDSFIHQLVDNGKRVVMMGDDTWHMLFPNHFNKSYPYPSFNVKDLDTVDNGCIEHLFPSLHEDDWDVLIAHFLGVDHAGHIFGVDSEPMIQKLEQYNLILEKVIDVLEKQSGPGGLHENTFLVVLGDHGQTPSGDHGGGSPIEVEASMFAMNFKKPPSTVPPKYDTSYCQSDRDGKKMCTSTMQQLDFAVTVSALLGIPFPFGSIGRVNPELYALGADTWNLEGTNIVGREGLSKLEEWVLNYANVLCINSWQVKRYVDVYSAASVIGFSSEDLSHISDSYVQAEEKWAHTTKNLLLNKDQSGDSLLPALTGQIDAYLYFLSNVTELARSKWTEFNLQLMGIGVGTMLVSLCIAFLALQRVNKLQAVLRSLSSNYEVSFQVIFAFFVVAIRASSLLSNSFICKSTSSGLRVLFSLSILLSNLGHSADVRPFVNLGSVQEGKVASFLLATTVIVKLRYSIMKKKMLTEVVIFLLLISLLRFSIDVGLSKQAATSAFLKPSSSWMLGFVPDHPIGMHLTEIGPIVAMILLACVLYRIIAYSPWGVWKFVTFGAILSYFLIGAHWASENSTWSIALSQWVGRGYIPRIVYALGLCQLLLVVFGQLFNGGKAVGFKKNLVMKTVALLSAWSPSIILLSGKQGSFVALAFIIGGYCILRLESVEDDAVDGTAGISASNSLAVIQWNLFAVCLFYATGHWCAFDGLRYTSAFIGFDEFAVFRQGVLLAVETYGFSLILPVFAIPLLAVGQNFSQSNHGKEFLFTRLARIYMLYGLLTATSAAVTVLCVTVQRRHLMVWGLFTPKFAFDAVGLIVTDVLICLAALFYSG